MTPHPPPERLPGLGRPEGPRLGPAEAKRSQADFTKATAVSVRPDVLAAKRTTLCVGGPIEHFVEPRSVAETGRVLAYLGAADVTPRVLGAGSNVLVDDRGLSGWVISFPAEFRTVRSVGGGRFEVGAGYSLMRLSRDLCDDGYSGLEWAGGIPAVLGGAVRMNAGAHGSDLASVVESVSVVLADGSAAVVPAAACGFSYRSSRLPEGAVVTGAVLRLVAGRRAETAKARAAYLAARKAAQPLSVPSVGSVFKNPESGPTAGALIEQCGLKGCAIGGAVVSPKHANWIVNPGKSATSDHVLRLLTVCRDEVFGRTGVALEPEVRIWCSERERDVAL